LLPAKFGHALVAKRFDFGDTFEQPLQKQGIVIGARGHPRFECWIVDRKTLAGRGQRIVIETTDNTRIYPAAIVADLSRREELSQNGATSVGGATG
jgi:hypothetical protein